MNSVDHRPSFFPRNSRSQRTKKDFQTKQGRAESAEGVQHSSQIDKAKKNSAKQAAAITQKTAQDAKVSIPEGIKDFSRIKKAAMATEEPDNTEKIARLKKQIQEGTYQIDYDALASKILDSEF